MRVVKPQGNARQEGYRGRLKSPQRDQYHVGKTRHGKSPKIRSKPLGPCFAAGKEHQREYGHGHASPDPRVKASSEKNKISRPKVHGTRGGRRRRHDRFRWSLIPSWADDPAIGNRMINARAETVAEKPAYRSAFRHRRCLVPADGFYEWAKANGTKQPHYFQLKDGGPFAGAGIWERWAKGQEEVKRDITNIDRLRGEGASRTCT